jgi:hypothetical protein
MSGARVRRRRVRRVVSIAGARAPAVATSQSVRSFCWPAVVFLPKVSSNNLKAELKIM